MHILPSPLVKPTTVVICPFESHLRSLSSSDPISPARRSPHPLPAGCRTPERRRQRRRRVRPRGIRGHPSSPPPGTSPSPSPSPSSSSAPSPMGIRRRLPQDLAITVAVSVAVAFIRAGSVAVPGECPTEYQVQFIPKSKQVCLHQIKQCSIYFN